MTPIRLQKFIADAGIMSRRAAEEEIKNGNISVNGHVAIPGTKINPTTDIVTYRNRKTARNLNIFLSGIITCKLHANN